MQRHVSISILAIASAIVVLSVSNAQAITSCKVKVDKRTGIILASAKDVGGTLFWGETATAVTSSFFNAGTCVVSGKAKKCQLADPTTLAAKTAPSACTLYLDDGVAPCAAWIPGCSPGARRDTGALAKDANGVLIGTLAGTAPPTVLRNESGTTVVLTLDGFGNGFIGGGGLLYASTNCTGTPMLGPDPSMVKYVAPYNGTGHFAPSTTSIQTLQSILYFYGSTYTDQSDCDMNFGPGVTSFVAPAACCGPLVATTAVGPTQTINLNAFATPFKIELQ